MLDFGQGEIAAVLHRREQRGGACLELVGLVLDAANQLGKNVVRQQADIFGEHTEQQAVEEMRHRVRFVPALA